MKSPSPSNRGFATNILIGIVGAVLGAVLGGYITLINALLPLQAQVSRVETMVNALWAIYGPK